MPSFLLAEDHSVVRMGITLYIRALYSNATITEAVTFDETIKELNKGSFDLLILDINIPGGDNLEMIGAIRLRQPDIAILIFSSYDELIYGPAYLKAGVNGYLSKTSYAEEIQFAIQKILNGERYMSAAIQEKLLDDLLNQKKNTQGNTVSLSHREMEVMNLFIKGATAKDIKTLLNISDSTISTHKANIFEKMQVTNIIQLAEKVKSMGKQVLHS
jgi:two-component system invasion response regulator UvrY